jgi:pyridoxamine 5'-phosphate oxidase-like protein
MRVLQDRFDGRRVADRLAAHRRRYDFWDDDRVMIETAAFFFIATSFGDYTDCSMRSGMPGFVKIVAPGTIEFPEYDGNSMYRTLGNISRNPNVGLLFVKFDGKTCESALMAVRAFWMMPRLWRGITRRSWWCGSNARCSPIARARCMTWRWDGCPPICRIPATNRPRQSGKAGIISRTFYRRTIRTAADSGAGDGFRFGDPTGC